MGKTPSPRYQAIETMKCIDHRGESKYEAKQAYYQQCRESGTKASMAELGDKMGIYSHRTADAYRDIWVQVLEHARTTDGINCMKDLTPEAIQRFMESKRSEEHTSELQSPS
jgi:hypothetical protein